MYTWFQVLVHDEQKVDSPTEYTGIGSSTELAVRSFYSIVLYCTVLCCIVLDYIVMCCVVLYCIILYCIVLCCVALHCYTDRPLASM